MAMVVLTINMVHGDGGCGHAHSNDVGNGNSKYGTVPCIIMHEIGDDVDIMDASNGDCNMMDVAPAADPIEKTKVHAPGSGGQAPTPGTRHKAPIARHQAAGVPVVADHWMEVRRGVEVMVARICLNIYVGVWWNQCAATIIAMLVHYDMLAILQRV